MPWRFVTGATANIELDIASERKEEEEFKKKRQIN